VPKSIYREDKIPYGQSGEIDEHPEDINNLASRDEDKDGR
jgi:hypothetical protein